MEIDNCEHVDEEKNASYQETWSCVANLSSLSDYHVLAWLEAHEYTASQWTKDAQCHFSPT